MTSTKWDGEQNAVTLLILTGPVGVGKTTVGRQVSVVLERRGIPHAFIDIDALTETFPRPPNDPFGQRLAMRNLHDVWANSVAAGAKNLVLARVVETIENVEEIQDAVAGPTPIVCQLGADDATLVQRVRTREVGSEREWHEARTLELARSLAGTNLADFHLDTDGLPVSDIAEAICDRVNWLKE